MNQAERHQLNKIIEEIETIRQHVPVSSTYSQGRVKANVATQLVPVLDNLKEMADDGTEKTAE